MRMVLPGMEFSGGPPGLAGPPHTDRYFFFVSTMT